MTEAQKIKQTIRREMRERLRSKPIPNRSAVSASACENLLTQAAYQSASSLLLFMSLHDELDVQLLYQRAFSDGKRVALPRYLPETASYGAFYVGDEPLVAGLFGALEPAASNPVPLNQLDLIVVPGLAFDLRGRRLGRGKGFYDRLLSEATGLKCGICFDEQLLPELPVEPHDVSMDFIATPTRWLNCRDSTPAL